MYGGMVRLHWQRGRGEGKWGRGGRGRRERGGKIAWTLVTGTYEVSMYGGMVRLHWQRGRGEGKWEGGGGVGEKGG